MGSCYAYQISERPSSRHLAQSAYSIFPALSRSMTEEDSSAIVIFTRGATL